MRDWNSHYPNEPMVIEPATTETFRVLVATACAGPVELLDQEDNLWRADRVFVREKSGESQ